MSEPYETIDKILESARLKGKLLTESVLENMIEAKKEEFKLYRRFADQMKSIFPPVAELIKHVAETDKANMERLKVALEEFRRKWYLRNLRED